MLICKFTMTGVSDLMFGTYVTERKLDDETHDQHEERTWQQKVRMTERGQVFLQPFALKNGLESAAKWLGLKIPGERGKMYKDRFTKGILVQKKMLLFDSSAKPVTIANVEPVRIFAPSDGRRGSPKRVFRIFPTIHEWQTEGEVLVFDNKITEEVLKKHAVAFGQFIGFGSMRVENGGINGRCAISEFAVEQQELEEAA